MRPYRLTREGHGKDTDEVKEGAGKPPSRKQEAFGAIQTGLNKLGREDGGT